MFKKENALESDRVFSVFTKDFGRTEIFGKAVRKIGSKLRGGIEIFAFSEIEFVEGRNRKTLTDSTFKEKFKDIPLIPLKMETAYKISETIDGFVRGEERDDKIFNLLRDVFRKINDCEKPNIAYVYFFWNFVSVLGYRPELTKCAVCLQKLNPYSLYFSSKDGGIICRNCARGYGLKVKSDIVKILRLAVSKNWDILRRLKLSDSVLKSLQEISQNYQNYLSLSALRAK